MSVQTLDSAATESLLAFWRDAGVDACFEDAPVDRTHVTPPPAVKAVAKAYAASHRSGSCKIVSIATARTM